MARSGDSCCCDRPADPTATEGPCSCRTNPGAAGFPSKLCLCCRCLQHCMGAGALECKRPWVACGKHCIVDAVLQLTAAEEQSPMHSSFSAYSRQVNRFAAGQRLDTRRSSNERRVRCVWGGHDCAQAITSACRAESRKQNLGASCRRRRGRSSSPLTQTYDS
jgi:hypothetical protein